MVISSIGCDWLIVYIKEAWIKEGSDESPKETKRSPWGHYMGHFQRNLFILTINKNPRTFLDERGFNNLFMASPF